MRRVATIVTSAYSWYSSCRQYREDLAAAQTEAVDEGLDIAGGQDRTLRNRPGFLAANARLVTDAVRAGPRRRRRSEIAPGLRHPLDPDRDGRDVGARRRRGAPLPAASTSRSGQHHRGGQRRTLDVDLEGELVFCSRSGPPSQPWLEPDVNDRIEELAAAGTTDGGRRPDRLRLRPHGGHLRPRHRGQGDGARGGRRARARADRRHRLAIRHRPRRRPGGACCRGAGRGRARLRGRRPSVCEPGCCPNLRVARPALCGRD